MTLCRRIAALFGILAIASLINFLTGMLFPGSETAFWIAGCVAGAFCGQSVVRTLPDRWKQ